MTNQVVRNELLDILTSKPGLVDSIEEAIEHERELMEKGRIDEYDPQSDERVRGWRVMRAGIPPQHVGTLMMNDIIDRIFKSNSGSSFRFHDLEACEEACEEFHAMMEDVARNRDFSTDVHIDEDYRLRIEEDDGFFHIVQEKPGVGEVGRIEIPPNIVDKLRDEIQDAHNFVELKRRYM